MTAPTVVPVLDEQTIAELQLPCDCEPCDRSATWGLKLRCPCRPHGFTALACDRHQLGFRVYARHLFCMVCQGTAVVVSVVPL